MSHFSYLIFHLLSVISVRRRTRSSRITQARDFWPMGRRIQDYLLWSNVQLLPYQRVHPSRCHGVDTCHEPSFSFSLFLPFNQTFNLDFPISCGRQTKDISLGENGHYGWTRVSTPPEPPALVEPPPLIPNDACTRRWPLPPAQKA